jgi:hypothetical protein
MSETQLNFSRELREIKTIKNCSIFTLVRSPYISVTVKISNQNSNILIASFILNILVQSVQIKG